MAQRPDSKPISFPPVAIVLVNWNNWLDCVECIDSLLGMDYPNFHVFVVDNDSRDGSVEKIRGWCANPEATPRPVSISGVVRWTHASHADPILCRIVEPGGTPLPVAPHGCRISLVRSGGNLGFAGGCNVGIRRACTTQFDYFWFLNTDTVVDQQALGSLIERAQSDAAFGMVGSTVLYHDRPHTVQALAGAWFNATRGESRHIGEGISVHDMPVDPTDVEQQLAYIFGASMLVSSALIKRIGLMQEDYFLYYEEMDWAMRSREYFRFGYAPRSLIYHKSGSSSSKAMPLFTANLFYRNRIRFMSRFFPQCLQATKHDLLLGMLRSLLKGRWAEALLIAGILYRADVIASEAVRQPQSALP